MCMETRVVEDVHGEEMEEALEGGEGVWAMYGAHGEERN